MFFNVSLILEAYDDIVLRRKIMFIFKNAWISIKRNKGRNILIGIIILIIACACTITLAIKNTAVDLIDSYKSAYDKEVTISFDRSNMMKDSDP